MTKGAPAEQMRALAPIALAASRATYAARWADTLDLIGSARRAGLTWAQVCADIGCSPVALYRRLHRRGEGALARSLYRESAELRAAASKPRQTREDAPRSTQGANPDLGAGAGVRGPQNASQTGRSRA